MIKGYAVNQNAVSEQKYEDLKRALVKLVYLAYRNAHKKMDDACPELGHYLTTTCDKVRR